MLIEVISELNPTYLFRIALLAAHKNNANNLITRLEPKEDSNVVQMLSQHLLGWPEHRPRSYIVLTRRATCFLGGDGIQALRALFRRPSFDVSSLYCAPKDRLLKFRFSLD